MPVARISRATSGGRPEASGGGGGGSPSDRGAAFGVARRALGGAGGQLVGRGTRPVRYQRAHLVEAGIDQVHRLVDLPPLGDAAPALEHRPAHQAGRPDVAEDAALVAQPVGQPCLAEQLVELGPMLLGHLAADVGDRRLDVGALEVPSGHGDPDRAHQRVRHRKRVGLGDVEPVQQAVSDQVEVPGHRLAGLAVERAQRGQHLAGVVVGREQLARLRIRLERGDQPRELGRGASRDGRRAAHQAEQLSRRHVRPVAHVRQEIPGRDDGRGRVAHVLRDHRCVVVAATRQILDQLLVGEGWRDRPTAPRGAP